MILLKDIKTIDDIREWLKQEDEIKKFFLRGKILLIDETATHFNRHHYIATMEKR